MKTIKYVGFDEATGYGIAAKNMVSALKQAGAIVHWTPVTAGTSAYDPHSASQVREGYNNVILHLVPEYYPSWIEYERSHNGKSKKIWCYTTWETDKIPRHWPELLNMMDGIIVPCNWNRDVFRQCGVKPQIEVAPHMSQFRGCEPAGAPSPLLERLKDTLGDRYVFYNIGVWSDRKAPWLLIQAFLSEFRHDEPVALVIKTGKYDYATYKRRWNRPWRLTPGKAAASFRKIMASCANVPKVIHIDDDFSDNDIAWLHKMGDCFVALGRGEGWGMGSFEAAWWGKPVITTGIGGVLDYLPEGLSWHVDYKLIPVRCEAGGQSYTTDQRWADPDLRHASRLMREVFENRQDAAAKGLRLKEHVSLNFSSGLIARRCLDFLEP